MDQPDFKNSQRIHKIIVFTFAVLIVSYSDGTIYFWGIKPNNKNRGECMFRSRNYYKLSRKIELVSVKSKFPYSKNG